MKVIHIQLTDAVIEMVKAGLGITIMNRWALKNFFGDKSLRFLPLTKNGFYRGWSLATTIQNSEKAYIKLFCELIKEEMKN